MENSEREKRVLRKLRHKIINALIKLDEKGTNETVSKAMGIVSTGFESAIEGKNWTGEEFYTIGTRRATISL